MNYLEVRSYMSKRADTGKNPIESAAEELFFRAAEQGANKDIDEGKAIRQKLNWFNGGRGSDAFIAQAERIRDAAKGRNADLYAHESRKAGDMLADVLEEDAMTKGDDWGKILAAKLPSYVGFTAGGALLGRLIAGKKNRLAGYLLGGLVGAGANYARRKSYYGDVINW